MQNTSRNGKPTDNVGEQVAPQRKLREGTTAKEETDSRVSRKGDYSGHQIQAGIGIEMVLRDAKNRTVGKFRHFAREGAQIEAAAQEVAGDLMKYIASH